MIKLFTFPRVRRKLLMVIANLLIILQENSYDDLNLSPKTVDLISFDVDTYRTYEALSLLSS